MIRVEFKARLRLCASLTFKISAWMECEGVFVRINETKAPITIIDKQRKIVLALVRRDIAGSFFITSFSARKDESDLRRLKSG